MSTHRPAILLTGFGPFPGVPINATSLLAPRLAAAARERFPGYRVVSHLLPTEWRAAPEVLDAALAETRPVLALHFGVSSRAYGFTLEMRARNHCSHAPDACGELPAQACIAADGPQFLPASIPAHAIVAGLRRRGIAASLSRDAGAYLCNAVLYHALSKSADRPRARRAGFVHLPSDLVDVGPGAHARAAVGCSLDWTSAIDGGLHIIAAALGRPQAVGPALA